MFFLGKDYSCVTKRLTPACSDRNQTYRVRHIQNGHATSSQFFSLNCFPQLQENFYLTTFSEQSEKKVTKIDSVYSYHYSLYVMWPFIQATISRIVKIPPLTARELHTVDSRTVDLDKLDLQITKEIVGY